MNILSNILKRNNTNITKKIFEEIWKGETLYNWFWETSITLMLKADGNITKKTNKQKKTL